MTKHSTSWCQKRSISVVGRDSVLLTWRSAWKHHDVARQHLRRERRRQALLPVRAQLRHADVSSQGVPVPIGDFHPDPYQRRVVVSVVNFWLVGIGESDGARVDEVFVSGVGNHALPKIDTPRGVDHFGVIASDHQPTRSVRIGERNPR